VGQTPEPEGVATECFQYVDASSPQCTAELGKLLQCVGDAAQRVVDRGLATDPSVGVCVRFDQAPAGAAASSIAMRASSAKRVLAGFL
jgi:hypothetical protein